VKIGVCAVIAGISFAVLLADPASAKKAEPAQHGPSHAVRHRHADLEYAQSHYDYRSASSVREEFADAPGCSRFDRYGDRREWHDGLVVENLRGDFNGGVGAGADGAMSFTDGYGQVHFFTGNFARGFGMGAARRFVPRPGVGMRPSAPRGR
jgi:hypothetical protein